MALTLEDLNSLVESKDIDPSDVEFRVGNHNHRHMQEEEWANPQEDPWIDIQKYEDTVYVSFIHKR